jgi:hypothetical protein
VTSHLAGGPGGIAGPQAGQHASARVDDDDVGGVAGADHEVVGELGAVAEYQRRVPVAGAVG